MLLNKKIMTLALLLTIFLQSASYAEVQSAKPTNNISAQESFETTFLKTRDSYKSWKNYFSKHPELKKTPSGIADGQNLSLYCLSLYFDQNINVDTLSDKDFSYLYGLGLYLKENCNDKIKEILENPDSDILQLAKIDLYYKENVLLSHSVMQCSSLTKEQKSELLNKYSYPEYKEEQLAVITEVLGSTSTENKVDKIEKNSKKWHQKTKLTKFLSEGVLEQAKQIKV